MSERNVILKRQKILILDYSVDRSETSAVRCWLPVNSDISSLSIDTEKSFPDDLINSDFTHVIHTGSALSITQDAPFTGKAVNYIQKARDKGLVQMGICYGHQLIAMALVGKHAVRSSPKGLEAGWKNVIFVNSSMRTLGVRKNETVWQHHFDEVIELPIGSELLAKNSHTRVQAYINYEQRLLGMQFHPEFDKEAGDKLFLNDKGLQQDNNYDVNEMIKRGPSFDVGKVFFSYFLIHMDS